MGFIQKTDTVRSWGNISFLISIVYTFSCGFVRHFICINSCLLTSFHQQQIAQSKEAAIIDPLLILQYSPAFSCNWFLQLMGNNGSKANIRLFAKPIMTLAMMRTILVFGNLKIEAYKDIGKSIFCYVIFISIKFTLICQTLLFHLAIKEIVKRKMSEKQPSN